MANLAKRHQALEPFSLADSGVAVVTVEGLGCGRLMWMYPSSNTRQDPKKTESAFAGAGTVRRPQSRTGYKNESYKYSRQQKCSNVFNLLINALK